VESGEQHKDKSQWAIMTALLDIECIRLVNNNPFAGPVFQRTAENSNVFKTEA
jgi:hypothetical protein